MSCRDDPTVGKRDSSYQGVHSRAVARPPLCWTASPPYMSRVSIRKSCLVHHSNFPLEFSRGRSALFYMSETERSRRLHAAYTTRLGSKA